MKKISIMLVVAMALFVTACGGSAKKAEAETTVVTETVADDTTAGSSDVLKKYEEFVDKAVPLLKKMKAGDASAAQDYTKLAEELGKFVMDNQDSFAGLSEKDAKKYAELSQKLVDAAQ